MNPDFDDALAALVIIAALSFLALACRWYFAPPKEIGRHRAPHPMLRPQEVMDNRPALCQAQARVTEHAFLHGGLRICWECRTPSQRHSITAPRKEEHSA